MIQSPTITSIRFAVSIGVRLLRLGSIFKLFSQRKAIFVFVAKWIGVSRVEAVFDEPAIVDADGIGRCLMRVEVKGDFFAIGKAAEGRGIEPDLEIAGSVGMELLGPPGGVVEILPFGGDAVVLLSCREGGSVRHVVAGDLGGSKRVVEGLKFIDLAIDAFTGDTRVPGSVGADGKAMGSNGRIRHDRNSWTSHRSCIIEVELGLFWRVGENDLVPLASGPFNPRTQPIK